MCEHPGHGRQLVVPPYEQVGGRRQPKGHIPSIRARAAPERVSFPEDIDHYGVAMKDPEGNEFDIN
jgi:hypothetical protein